tara:strand:- start:2841 stop:4148 length:1308 start_codon:yes stop_codon:yes gene_type:complete
MNKYDTFEDIEQLLSGIVTILQDPPDFFDEDMIQEFSDLMGFCEEVLEDREESEYFMYLSPFDLIKTEDSQGRAVTIDPDHAADVKNSIVSAQKVYVAGFVKDCSGGQKKEIINCNHRHEKSIEAIKEKLLPSDFKMPVVCVPRAISNIMSRALDEVQDILNSGMPKKLNNSNDMVSSMTRTAYNHEIDLDIKEQYDDFVSYFQKKYPQSTLKTVKSNATRVKNKKNLETCDVWCDSTKNFTEQFLSVHKAKKPAEKSEFYNFTKSGKNYKNCKIEVASTKGSSYDQLFRRDANFNYDNPDKKIIHLVVCQVNKGDPQTTLTTRKTYFKNLYRDWVRFGKFIPTDLGAELVIIAPQNMGTVETKIHGDDSEVIKTLKEIKDLASHWKAISRTEIISFFDSEECNAAMPYKSEWIVSEDNLVSNVIPFDKENSING